MFPLQVYAVASDDLIGNLRLMLGTGQADDRGGGLNMQEASTHTYWWDT
jgi:hypothetical protein